MTGFEPWISGVVFTTSAHISVIRIKTSFNPKHFSRKHCASIPSRAAFELILAVRGSLLAFVVKLSFINPIENRTIYSKANLLSIGTVE